MLIGLVEAVWGMQQLHGHVYSHHSLFRLTGSFFNPGPIPGIWRSCCRLPVDSDAVSKGDALFRLGMRRGHPGCLACRDEPVGLGGGGCGLRVGVLGGTDRMGKDESHI